MFVLKIQQHLNHLVTVTLKKDGLSFQVLVSNNVTLGAIGHLGIFIINAIKKVVQALLVLFQMDVSLTLIPR
jgi:hypothetical protein